MNFGNNIRQLREKAELSQVEFAKLLNVPQSNIPRWENGSIIPSLNTIVKICQKLNLSTDELIFSPKERKKYQTSNLALLKRLKSIEKLTTNDQSTLFQIIDAFIKSKK